MATYDNKIWLLKMIKDSFVTTDDSGLCEVVMAGEDLSKAYRVPQTTETPQQSDDELVPTARYESYPDIEDSDEDDMFHGSEILLNEKFRGYRQRSNTEWMEKREEAMKKAAEVKYTKWSKPAENIPAEEISDMFTKIEVTKPIKQKSLLSEQLQNPCEFTFRQYLDYAKYDGTEQLGVPTRSYKIFMTMIPGNQQEGPLVVRVLATAKISDLIGLICYKYSIENPEVPLGPAENYGLCIADDDGEVDWGFPCLDSGELCSKFGFTCLGLVDLKSIKENRNQPYSMPEDGEVFGDAFSGFPKAMEVGQSTQNSSRHNTGASDTSEALKYALQSVNEVQRAAGKADLEKMQSHIIAAEAAHHKIYRIQMSRKLRKNIPVELGISLDKIEVDPFLPTKRFSRRPKYLLHIMDSVAACHILEAKVNKTIFRIIYSPNHGAGASNSDKRGGMSSFFHSNSTTYKIHDFECEHNMAKEIVEKVNTILDLKNSPCRREYKSSKEVKKQQVGKSFRSKYLNRN